MTPFKKAGYTKDTKFKVILSGSGLSKGDIVTLEYDDETTCLKFKNSKGVYDYMYLPGEAIKQGFEEELEIYEESTSTPTLNLGEVGSPRYEAIRMVLALLDGDMVKYGESNDYCGLGPKAPHNLISSASEDVALAIKSMEKDAKAYQLKSESVEEEVKAIDKQIKALKNKRKELLGK